MTDIQRPSLHKQDPTQTTDPQEISNTMNILGDIKSEVAGEAAPLLSFVVTHIKIIVAAIVLLISAIVGYGTWQWKTEQADREAQIKLGRVLLTENPEARLNTLEAFLKEASANTQPGILAEIASLAAQTGNDVKAAEAYSRLYECDPKGSIGLSAAINYSELLQRLNKPAQALAMLQKIEYDVPESLKIFTQKQIAFALEASGNIKEAISHYETLSKHESIAADESAHDYYRFKISMLEKKLAQK